MKPFNFFYALTALLLYMVALPLLLVLIFKRKYRHSLPARFFLWNNPPFQDRAIWFHACSLGEVKALRPILEALPDQRVNISTITHTGFDAALAYDADVRYLPYEIFLPFWMKKQKTVVVLEAEFWYLLFAIAKARGGTLLLLNARISERSYPKYMKWAWLYRRMLAYVDTVYCQSVADQQRFESLGAQRVIPIGNIKLAQNIETTQVYDKPEKRLIVAASTHEGEEAIILEAFLEYAQTHRGTLVVVPRHPERFERVWELLQRYSTKVDVQRWSETQHFDADVVLVDAMGELNNIYAIADVAILGGAFREDVGGHNPLEPAHFGCKVISGEHFFHQKELFKYVSHLQIVAEDEIGEALVKAETLPPSQVTEGIDLDRFLNEIR